MSPIEPRNRTPPSYNGTGQALPFTSTILYNCCHANTPTVAFPLYPKRVAARRLRPAYTYPDTHADLYPYAYPHTQSHTSANTDTHPPTGSVHFPQWKRTVHRPLQGYFPGSRDLLAMGFWRWRLQHRAEPHP